MLHHTKELHRGKIAARREVSGAAQAALIVRYGWDRQAEFGDEWSDYFLAGKRQNKETVIAGIDQTESAFIGLFDGRNIGRLVEKPI